MGRDTISSDDDIITLHQQRDLSDPEQNRPDAARKRQEESELKREEDDVRMNEGLGSVLDGRNRRRSETEASLARAAERKRRA